MKYKLTIERGGESRTVTAPEEMTLLEILRREGIRFAAPCGGHGACGKCRVSVSDSGGQRRVLACRTLLRRDMRLSLPEASGGILEEGKPGQTGVTPDRSGLGAAVDLGTTTLVAELYDLSDGRLLGRKSAWNAQSAYGADVITRIQYTIDEPDGLQTLRDLVHGQIAEMLRSLGAEPETLRETVIAGNTIMQHIHAGLDPRGLASAPYAPVSLFTDTTEEGLLYAPCAASYVGGDIMAGLLSAGLHRQKGQHLFLDIGTNGEMALGGSEGFLCCAAASGPAFEGAGIACGMAGTEGAVSRVRWGEQGHEIETVGGAEPRGLCGSGLIDLLGLLAERRLIGPTGRLLPPEEAPPGFEKWLDEDENGNGVFYLDRERGIYLGASDVRQLQLAKAAVAAGIHVLLETAGIRAEGVSAVILSGGFGSYLDPKSAAAIGMLPPVLAQKARALGNCSLAGARMALLDLEKRREMLEIQSACRYLDLSGNAMFMREYPEQMFFYEEDEDEWN